MDLSGSLCKEQKMTERGRERDLLLVGSFFLPITEKAPKWLRGEKKQRAEGRTSGKYSWQLEVRVVGVTEVIQCATTITYQRGLFYGKYICYLLGVYQDVSNPV